VVKVLKPGTYKLADEDDEELTNACNIQQLRRFYPEARISKFFVVNYMPNTPVGSTNVNNSKLIKLKGNLAFPRKPSHPRGLLRGASPPKNGPIFSQKIRKRTEYDSTVTSSEFRRGAGGQAERTREPEIAYTFARIRPFSLASGPAGYSRNRTPQPEFTQAKKK
jgi:hypothetical protein